MPQISLSIRFQIKPMTLQELEKPGYLKDHTSFLYICILIVLYELAAS